ncbi:ATP-binding protein [Streptomyces sp. 8L]|uniref:ATP-binding protein n=1 Tax=Streptomyces sp. 8L TaxID=2877242 RepID=UPI001CD609C1|nr:ATP-binding protein [Streptomyces sp. 8L]MCA1216851.1 ATP-binding protein [Streptomyces sp. 8L]
MSVPVVPRPRRQRPARPSLAPPALLVTAGAGAGAACATAPDQARGWVAWTAVVGWLLLAVLCVGAGILLRRARLGMRDAGTEAAAVHARLAKADADVAHFVHVALPAVAEKARDGASPDEARAVVRPPDDERLREVLDLFATELAGSERRAATAGAERDALARRAREAAEGLDTLLDTTLPPAIARLRKGSSAGTVLNDVERPDDPTLASLMEWIIKEVAIGERRALVAQKAGTKALSQVQAKAVTILADLRDMEDRYGEEAFGDLLQLDHNASQLGLLTDRLAILLGGRGSRIWNKPIVMESILRGAAGRIAAYRRVRLNCSSGAAIVGFAAEGVIHLLAELMDNAANFSPPIDEVHVYVEERTAGIVVTVEDSGLKMAPQVMRLAEKAVSGRHNDLSKLHSTRLGLAVVGRLAERYRISVNYRPSSRGGTGVVVLIPPQLIAQPQTDDRAGARLPARHPAPEGVPAPATPRAPVPAPSAPSTPLGSGSPSASGGSPPYTGGPRVATTGGLPVRPPGRTMAAADRDRVQDVPPPRASGPSRNVGEQFGAFHRSRQPRQEPSDTSEES